MEGHSSSSLLSLHYSDHEACLGSELLYGSSYWLGSSLLACEMEAPVPAKDFAERGSEN